MPPPKTSVLPRRRLFRFAAHPLRQFTSIILLLFALTAVGTVGLRLTTGGDWFDCLYMAVITLTTVGYAETVELGRSGRWFIMVYLAASIGVFTFSAFTLGSLLVSPGMQAFWMRRRMRKSIEQLSGHHIVCGVGRMGLTIAEYLEQRQKPIVVIDHDQQRLASICEPRGWLTIVGDATDDATLHLAGVERAKSLAAVLPSDADNVYVVLSSHMLAPKLQIIARAGDTKAVEKLQRAGASRVVSPFNTGAIKMARFMLTPTIEDFLEITDVQGHDLELAEIQITPDNPYVGKSLAETDLHEKGVMIIGIRRSTGERLMPPPLNTRILSGDSLFAFGSAAAVNRLISNDPQTQ